MIAAVVLTYNEARHIGACLDTLAWADRRVVFDSFSTDDTVALARARGAEVFQHAFTNFAAQRNAALEAVDAEWIFFVDADERVPERLAAEIRRVLAQTPASVAAYTVPRDNYLFGRLTRGAGYWPDHQTRLLRRGRAHYERPASEIVVMDGTEGRLREALLHYNYDSIDHFHAKQQLREAFEVENLYRRGLRAKFYTPYTQFVRHFWWRYVTLKGYEDGWHGIRLAGLLAYYFGYRYFRALRARGR